MEDISMNMKALARELRRILIRYRAGMISLEECRQEQSIILGMMKLYEMTILEERLDRLEAVMDSRR
jgi:transcription initiation factor IIE alpha subunit